MKTIGVMPLLDTERESLWMLPNYFDMILSEGAIPVMLPLTTDITVLSECFEKCDGFLMTGGQDVCPSLYGEEKSPFCGEPCELRDIMDSYFLTHAREENKSLLGICRGVQIMNARFGGTLYQDLPTQITSEVNHQMTSPYNRSQHYVYIKHNTMLYDILKTDTIGVNSYHHQGIKDVAKGFEVCASAEDGLVESINDPTKRFFLAVQWHPEFSYKNGNASQKIVKAFVNSL